jgi:hypothetical protein
MNMMQSVKMMLGYIYEGVAMLFGPSQDNYPMVGASAFEGDIYKGSNWAD